MKKFRVLSIVASAMLLLLVFSSVEVNAQCAMCRAAVENNISESSDSFAAGLNNGILYLMVIPYILISTIAYMWYKNSKKHTEEVRNLKRILEGKI